MSEISNELYKLASKLTLVEQINVMFSVLRQLSPAITRVSIVLYNRESGMLNTFYKIEEPHTSSTPTFYQFKLDESPSLLLLSQCCQPRIIDSLIDSITNTSLDIHTNNTLLQAGFKSSLTLPMYFDGHFQGFIFINANTENIFRGTLQHNVIFTSHFISQIVHTHVSKYRTFKAAVNTILTMGHARDPETQGHLTRMSLYCELMAQALAEKYQRSAYFPQQMKMYAPLHDIGKYRIPDSVLFSTEKFTANDRKIMNKHPEYGIAIIEEMQKYFSFEDSDDIYILKNIILFHHERIDGRGYPCQLTGNNIPLEARIVTVADVFDALMSKRLYKKAWTLPEVQAYLDEHSGSMFCSDCVNALNDNMDSIIKINQQFQD